MTKLVATCVHCNIVQFVELPKLTNILLAIGHRKCKGCSAWLTSAVLSTPEEGKTLIVSQPFEGKDKQWYFNVKGLNHEIVLASEGYTRKGSANRFRKALQNCQMIVEK